MLRECYEFVALAPFYYYNVFISTWILSCFFFVMFSRQPKFAMTSLGFVMLSSWATTIYISVWHQYKARIQEPFEMFDPLYDKPWSRIGPYLVGEYLTVLSRKVLSGISEMEDSGSVLKEPVKLL